MYHANGYFTLYGHMSLITSIANSVYHGRNADWLDGHHNWLRHFHWEASTFRSLLRRWQRQMGRRKNRSAVDPFGWEGRLSTPAVEDPWVSWVSEEGMNGPVSGHLWMYPDQLICPIISTGPTTCSDPTDAIHAQVAVGTLPSGSQLTVSRSPVASPPFQLLTAGASFRLRTGTPTGSAVLTTNSAPDALPQPITLQVTWDATASRHLNMNQTVLYARSRDRRPGALL